MDLHNLIGTELTKKVEKQLTSNVRVVRQGQLLTMDYDPFRTNIHVDSKNIITRITQG